MSDTSNFFLKQRKYDLVIVDFMQQQEIEPPYVSKNDESNFKLYINL